MKKCLIYLLTLVMVLSPMAVFAGTGEDNDPETVPAAEETAVPEEEAVPEEPAEKAAPAPEEVAVPEEEAAPEEVVPEEPAEEAEEAALKAVPAETAEATEETLTKEAVTGTTNKTYADNEECFWVEGSGRTKAVDKDGNQVYGLFKAMRLAGKLGLYYADEETGIVVSVEGLVTPKAGNKFTYTKVDGETGWTTTGGGPYTYLIKEYNEGDFYITNELENLVSANGKTYYVKNGIVRTNAGVQDFSGAKYYIQDGGEVLKTVGFTPDKKYYIPAADGKIRTTQGIFKANNGKTYYSGAGGVIPSTAGLYSAGNTQYYVNADGSVKTDAGFITVGVKKYLVNAGGAISKTNGVVSFGGNYYVAEPGGAIHTATGFYETGGQLYYVTNSSGVLKVNKAFKVSGKKYHAAANGIIIKGVHKWGKYYYYATSSGALRSKAARVKWNNNYYLVKKGGKVYTGKKVKFKGKYYIAKKSGVLYRGVFKWKKNLYYADSKGRLRTKAGLFKYDGSRYYSRKGGKLYKNTLFKAGGKKYLAQSDGRIKIGYFAWKSKFYITNEKGAIYTKAGIYTYNKKQYFVKSGGAMANQEFVTYKDDHYYVDAHGAIVKKTFKYKGIKITPNSKTGIISLEDYWKVFPDEKPTED